MRVSIAGIVAIPLVVGGLGVAAAVVVLGASDTLSPTRDESVEESAQSESGAEGPRGGTAIEGTRPHLTVIDGFTMITLPGAIPEILSILPPSSADLPPLATAPADLKGQSSDHGAVPPVVSPVPLVKSPVPGVVPTRDPSAQVPRHTDTVRVDEPSRSTEVEDSPSRATGGRGDDDKPAIDERVTVPPPHAVETGRPDHADTTGRQRHASGNARQDDVRKDDRRKDDVRQDDSRQDDSRKDDLRDDTRSSPR